jgi:hypothetical protein
VTAVACAVIAAGALVTAAALRDRTPADHARSSREAPPRSGVDADGCFGVKCTVLASVPVAGTTVELVAEAGGTAGRLRIGGGGTGYVFEATITGRGATLTKDSLQCVASTLSACLLRGRSNEGVVGQVFAGRTGNWAELRSAFVSGAGFLALADVEAPTGPEILAAQHRCAPGADCAATPVTVEVYSLGSELLGCTRDYARLESIPGWPSVDLADAKLRPCA